jgi:hypothetical protein
MTEVNFFDVTNENFLGVIWRLAINLFFLFILIKLIYYKYSQKEKYVFSFFLMGILTFFVTSMLRSINMGFGTAFGLFAVLGILRLRASNFTVKDMAYTFAVLGLSVINALEVFNFPIVGIFFVNIIIILAAYFLEQFQLNNKTEVISITYENLDLLRPDKKLKLIKDVSVLTGKEAVKIRVRRIDYRDKIAILDVTFRVPQFKPANSV